MASTRTLDKERLKQHQLMYKGKTPPWKEAFREKCIQRLRSSRSRLVDQFRGLDVNSSSSNIDCLIQEEWNSLCETQNTLPSLYKGTIDDKTLDDIEVDEIISFMDQIQKELVEEEKKMLAERYADIESSLIASDVAWYQEDEVICPLCRRFPLVQNLSVIFCKCGLRIDTQQDGLTLVHVKKQLYQCLDSHDMNCSCPPTFSLISLSDITNLAMICDACCFMYIVI